LAARNTPSKGGKPDKIMRDALSLELAREDKDPVDGLKAKRVRLIAKALIRKGMEGDVAAIREINDRMDGKVPQGIAGPDGESPATVILEVVWKGLNVAGSN
jgi:hypothetical protein